MKKHNKYFNQLRKQTEKNQNIKNNKLKSITNRFYVFINKHKINIENKNISFNIIIFSNLINNFCHEIGYFNGK